MNAQIDGIGLIEEDRLSALQGMAQQAGIESLTEDEFNELAELTGANDVGDYDHWENLAEQLDDNALHQLLNQCLEWFEADEESCSAWRQREKLGMLLLGISEEKLRGANFEGASEVTHPMLAEAIVNFNARAMSELWPPGGPVKTGIIGEIDEQREEQAQRVEQFMNYQHLELMPEAYEEDDRMLIRLPLSGCCFKKVRYDASLGTVTSHFVDPANFVVPYSTKSLRTATRMTEVIRMSGRDMEERMSSGEYRQVDLATPTDDSDGMLDETVKDTVDTIEGKFPSGIYGDDQYRVLEMCLSLLDLSQYDDTVQPGYAPYVVTFEYEQQIVLAIRRNWHPDDPESKPIESYIKYDLIPGFGFYGFGYLHLIGDLCRALTGSLRALLDSAQFANMQGGFRSRDIRIKEPERPLSPGEWRETENAIEELQRAFFAMPYKEPPKTLRELLEHLEMIGRRIIGTTEAVMGDASNTGPVGTTLALIEQALKIPAAIHARIHRSKTKELRIIAQLNRWTLPQVYPYEVEGESREVMATDFDERVDVIPVSNPEMVSGAQRIAQAQAVLELVNGAPDLYGPQGRREAHERMLRALKVSNVDALLPEEEQTPRMDPVSENAGITMMRPVQAYPDQDHIAHQIVHQHWFETLDAETQTRLEPAYMAHQAEHMAWDYTLRMQQAMGMQLPGTPLTGQQIDPQMEQIFAIQAAQVAQLMRDRVQMPTSEDMTAQREQDRKDVTAAAEIQRKDAIAAADIDRQNAKTEAQMTAEAVRAAMTDLSGTPQAQTPQEREFTV